MRISTIWTIGWGGVVESSWNATLPTDNQIDFTLSFNFGFFKVNLLVFVYVCSREMMWRSKNTMGFIEEEKAKKWSEKSGYVRSWVRMTEANAYRNFLSDEEKKDQEHRKMAHIFHGKKFVRPANIHKRTHTHIKQSTNNHIIDLYWVNRFTWFPMTMDGTVPSLSAVVFGFVIVCIFMSRTNMLRELMAYGRCDNNNSEQRTATVHETIAANDVSFAYFRLRLIDSQFKWHKSKLCYVVCRNFKSIFSNSNKTVHSNRNRKC